MVGGCQKSLTDKIEEIVFKKDSEKNTCFEEKEFFLLNL
jgi:hypothetical protein